MALSSCDVAEEQRHDLTVKRFHDVPTFRVTSRQVSDSTPVNGPSCSLIARSEKAETPRGNAIMNSLNIDPRNSIDQSPLRCGFLLEKRTIYYIKTTIRWLAGSSDRLSLAPGILILLALACFMLSASARAEDGTLPGGGNNTAEGSGALVSVTSGTDNTAIGVNALEHDNTGSNNTAAGTAALASNTSGSGNTATGLFALQANVSGSSNTATGVSALNSNTTGSFNTAVGPGALSNNNADNNTAIGYLALEANTSGTRNTAAGVD